MTSDFFDLISLLKSKDFPTLVELNKDYGQFKPNSDVFVEEYNGVIFGTSCKQNSGSPLTNKIAEDYATDKERLFLTNLRETLLHEFNDVIEWYLDNSS